MRVRTAVVVLAAISLLAGLAVSAPDQGNVTAVEGNVTLADGERVTEGATLAEGARIRLAEGARLSVRFVEDGATMDLTGPAEIVLVELAEVARTISLLDGRMNRFVAEDVTTAIETPFRTRVAVRNGTVAVEVDESNAGDRVTFKLYEGTDAKVDDDGRIRALGTDEPIVITRPRGVRAPTIETARPIVEGVSKDLKIGVHTITITPEHGFTVQPTPGGGVLITSILPEGQFGQVSIDRETNFYLSNGEFIEFDANGNVVRHNAIVHVYAALDRRALYDEAVADPSDASPIGRDD